MLQRRQLMLRGAKPLKKYSPLRIEHPLYAVTNIEEMQSLINILLGSCGYADLIEVACEYALQEKPPISYVVVGDVAIVSLDERLRGREREVAEELLRRVKGIRSVYGKEATLGEYRVQKLIHLAGEERRVVTYREHGLVFRVPLGEVYINPRLATEHYRLASLVGSDEIVLDMFSGIGGFALTISMLGRARLVVANDINPKAIEVLIDAIARNRKRLRTPVMVLNMDARELQRYLRPVFTRIIMNLPHHAVEFLDIAKTLCSTTRGCIIHVYVVASSEEEALGIVPGGVRVTRVLDYAPRKFIYRVDMVYRPAENQ
jgi:tRNA (guanine37-N1)-methyltransferase